jgi:putative oxygen-independent coproporphyrinogen III oxidase
VPWPPRSAYLHIPFCHRRCFYCDFPVVPLGDRAGAASGQSGSASIAAYLALLQREIALAPAGPPLSTVYLGGGTPSLLLPAHVSDLLEALAGRFGLAPGAEITMELDPASFDQARLAAYLAAGVNRVSLGGQSFNDGVLATLGRRHRCSDLLAATGWLAGALDQGRLASWSLDLIQAVPGQTTDLWREQLLQAIGVGAPHLSVYDLSIEPGTVFAWRQRRGELPLPDDELAADLMELTAAELVAAGYGHYEVSNYALPGHASRHNRVYWSGAGWWGFGMGATAALDGQRQARPRTREAYRQWLGQQEGKAAGAPDPVPSIDLDAWLEDQLIVGLRRREGIRPLDLLITAGLGPSRAHQALEDLRRHLELALQRGLVLWEGSRWRLSDPAGLALSNAVLRECLLWWEGWRGDAVDRQASPAEPAPPGSGQPPTGG